MTLYGFVVGAWLVFNTGNLDQQPTYLPFPDMGSCQSAAKALDEGYRYHIVCVPTAKEQ